MLDCDLDDFKDETKFDTTFKFPIREILFARVPSQLVLVQCQENLLNEALFLVLKLVDWLVVNSVVWIAIDLVLYSLNGQGCPSLVHQVALLNAVLCQKHVTQ